MIANPSLEIQAKGLSCPIPPRFISLCTSLLLLADSSEAVNELSKVETKVTQSELEMYEIAMSETLKSIDDKKRPLWAFNLYTS